jgi:hypothetical protein
MRDLNSELKNNALETRLRRLERTLTLVVVLWLLALGVLWSNGGRPVSAQIAKPATDVLRIRQLVIVDEKGVERVVVGPMHDARIEGKLVKRRSPATGVMVNDAAGNERVGLAVMEDGSAAVGIDNEHGQERAHLYWLPNRGSGLLLKGDKPKEEISLSIPREGTQLSGPTVDVSNEAGAPVYPSLTSRK